MRLVNIRPGELGTQACPIDSRSPARAARASLHTWARQRPQHHWRIAHWGEAWRSRAPLRDAATGLAHALLVHGVIYRAFSFGVVTALAGLLAVCCSSPIDTGSDARSSQPPNWDAQLRLPEAVDVNPAPHVFETTLTSKIVNLEVVPGRLTPVWTYNGLLPGPLIRVARGDRLIVHLVNELPDPTTIHWHGIRLPNAMDGVPGTTQREVEPGSSFDYDFVVPDSGTFWYHPHVDSAAQVGFGLYGPLIVTDPDEAPGLGDELVLLLSDMMVSEDGTQADPTAGGELATLFGREGDTLLVNGKVNPVLHAVAARRQRWRLINAAKSRYFQLMLDGQQFTRIGGDQGLIESPQSSDRILLTPAQRADVVLDLAVPSATTRAVRWVPYDRGFGSTEFRSEETLFTVQTSADPGQPNPALPPLHREILPINLSNPTMQYLDLTASAKGEPFSLGINGVPAERAAPLTATLGEIQMWSVHNSVAFAHPFHLHGFFFQVIDVDGIAPAVGEWHDTVNVPIDATVRLAVSFDERPGLWMFHCHILDHADAGMMGMVALRER